MTCMKYGYMPSSEVDLFSEIDFAKKYFDFIEITLKLDLSEYNKKYISKLNAALKNFDVLGHLHWEIDLSKGHSEELKKVYKSVMIFKKLGVEKITIHPSSGNRQNIEQVKRNNLFALSKIANFCRRNKLHLLVENTTSVPFNRMSDLEKLVNNITNLGITLDIGHVYRTSKSEVNKFLKLKNKIGHIHLHDTIGKQDHLAFRNRMKLKQIINKIKRIRYDGTVTLEIFYVLKNNEPVPVDGKDKRELLIKQLEFIKN